MRLEPTLKLEKAQIIRSGRPVYSEEFHDGINIISGENSSGKSTILNLIIYGLGADIGSWSEYAKLCERVVLQVKLNGSVATLSREINPKTGQPMDIFPGSMDDSEVASRDEWVRFPYRSTGGRETFSQAIFKLLSIPELETESSGKLTMHQILRVLYSDQLSSVDSIFRDDNFDTPALRSAVGRLLMGAYDAEIYKNQLTIRALQKELNTVQGALRSLYVILGHVEHNLTMDWVKAAQNSIESEITAVAEEISETKKAASAAESKGASLAPQNSVRNQMVSLQNEIDSLEQAISELTLDIADSKLFIDTLESKAGALKDSETLASELGTVQYTHCPSCRAQLFVESNSHSCHLCKEPFDEKRLRQRIVAQLNQMQIQLNQSNSIQNERFKTLRTNERELEKKRNRWRALNQELEALVDSPTSEFSAKIQKLIERQGYLKRDLEALVEKSELIEQLDEMSEKKALLNSQIASLEDRNERLLATERERLMNASSRIAEKTAEFLREDLPRQDSFENAQSVNFDFSKDRISVDGQFTFSASSTVYLKNSFLSAFLFAACEDKNFRHPRFLVLDTIEDKGIEPERSKNFQDLLVTKSESVECDHQVIFATAMISEDLDQEKYLVGRKSSHEQRTLAIR